MSAHYDEYTDLLGAYALDAVEHEERERVENHLRDCPRCRAEVAEHREVAALLSHGGADAPDGVWDRIVAELSPPAPPMRLTLSPEHSAVGATRERSPEAAAEADNVVSFRRRAAGVSRRAMLGVVAVAASVVAVLGIVAVGQSNRLERLETAMEDRTIESMANEAVADAAVTARLSGAAGSAEAVVAPNGQGYLIMNDMPEPADGNLYQLWGQVDGTVLSLGTFGGGTSIVPFSVDPARVDGVSLFAVTEERSPGVVSSEQDPVMAGTV